MVVSRLRGRTTLTLHGPETTATLAELPPDGQWFGVRFSIGTFMPLLSCAAMRDRRDITLPNATRHSFWLNGSAWDFPTFDNADTFVARLVREGLIATDSGVAGAARGKPHRPATRTEQRRVRQITGLTRSTIRQIERTRLAALLLQQGTPTLDVVEAAGFYDQAHLTHALRRYIGQTPGQIVRQERQLSLLYKT
jgi:hypothetical protein